MAGLTPEIIAIVAILGVMLVLFAATSLRHDIVAGLALATAVLIGLVPAGEAFDGFGHPAVVTIALVLVLSKALVDTGAIDLIVEPVNRMTGSTVTHILALSLTGGVLSAFMNNVGALALLMPLAMQTAKASGREPSLLLMPLAFGTILGGMATLIGTPPNLIVSGFRAEATGAGFSMFDFAFVGAPVALVGILFIATLGYRLIPLRGRTSVSAEDYFELADYVVELEVLDKGEIAGMRFGDAARLVDKADGVLLALERGDERHANVPRWMVVKPGDLLMIEVAPDVIEKLAEELGLAMSHEGADKAEEEEAKRERKRPQLTGDHVQLVEMVVTQTSQLYNRRVASLALAERFNIDLLGIARSGGRIRTRLREILLEGGDVLLLRGESERISAMMRLLGGLPLATRGVRFGRRDQALTALAAFAAAIALASLGLVSTPIAFGLAVLGLALARVIPVRELYDGIDWSIIVLLAALMPVGGALQTTGATALLTEAMAQWGEGAPFWLLLVLVMAVTMILSDVLNNAATVILMAPIGIGLAQDLGHPVDAYLMAVALGGSAAFLTPIGHQNNTLVMGAGGYAFGDYWRMGLPLEILMLAIATPLLLFFWQG